MNTSEMLFFTMCEELRKAMVRAGGSYLSFDALADMSVLEMFDICSKNGIRVSFDVNTTTEEDASKEVSVTDFVRSKKRKMDASRKT